MNTNRLQLTLAAVVIMVQLFFGFQSVPTADAYDMAVRGTVDSGVCNDVVCG